MGLIRLSKRWPRRQIPYVISRQATNRIEPLITNAVADWNAQTVIQLMPLLNYMSRFGFTRSWIRFRFRATATGLCNSSATGRAGGVQDIRCGTTPNAGATNFGVYVHEIGHALGLYHEQQRWDRDNFVFLVEEQIDTVNDPRPGNYKKKWPPYNVFSQLYDTRSVMHYGPQTVPLAGGNFTYFGALPGVGPIGRTRRTLPDGTRTWLSQRDINTINGFY